MIVTHKEDDTLDVNSTIIYYIWTYKQEMLVLVTVLIASQRSSSPPLQQLEQELEQEQVQASQLVQLQALAPPTWA